MHHEHRFAGCRLRVGSASCENAQNSDNRRIDVCGWLHLGVIAPNIVDVVILVGTTNHCAHSDVKVRVSGVEIGKPLLTLNLLRGSTDGRHGSCAVVNSGGVPAEPNHIGQAFGIVSKNVVYLQFIPATCKRIETSRLQASSHLKMRFLNCGIKFASSGGFL